MATRWTGNKLFLKASLSERPKSTDLNIRSGVCIHNKQHPDYNNILWVIFVGGFLINMSHS